MINIRFEEREKIGLQYALETLHGCSPFGQEKIRKLRYYSPDEREELETELYNVEQAAKAADALKPLYDRIGLMLCQMKDIRGSLRRCQALEIPDHVELFEIKVYLQRLESLIPLFQQVCQTTHFKALAFHDPAQALEILDPDKTRSRGFYIPDNATPKLREIRAAKKQIEEQLHHAQTDAEKEELRSAGPVSVPRRTARRPRCAAAWGRRWLRWQEICWRTPTRRAGWTSSSRRRCLPCATAACGRRSRRRSWS
ncbi:MAG: hypothetical protein ACLTGT_05375 [Oscillospiraceae bacterium]